jgi:hypothetical protein
LLPELLLEHLIPGAALQATLRLQLYSIVRKTLGQGCWVLLLLLVYWRGFASSSLGTEKRGELPACNNRTKQTQQSVKRLHTAAAREATCRLWSAP